MIKYNKVVTFGCRLNIYESEIIKNQLKLLNDSDNLIVINSCAVTKSAEEEAKKKIRQLKKKFPEKKIIVTGCAAQVDPESFQSMPEVTKVIGNEEKLHSKYYQLDESSPINAVSVQDIMSVKAISTDNIIKEFQGKSRAFIQIQNGCDHRCTFCKIPYARGNSRSVPIEAIAKQINILLDGGYKEVVFTGINVTSYGQDLPGQPTLAQMIKRILLMIPKLNRLRLSSIDVAEIDQDLFNLIATNYRIMPHIHISLQSGDNMILKRMKRRHTHEQVIDFCQHLRKYRSNIAFGADIIVGFPTENDTMFENTRNLIMKADLQYLHIFPYSKRDGTPASRMPQITKEIIKYRANQLKQDSDQQLKKFLKKNIGENVELLVEQNNIAHTENFIPVQLEEEFEIGSILKAKLASVNNNKMKILPIKQYNISY
ncbi:tRNA (N(6)-L-threonylcarbamoyladenosine(37)-C(2))-methylthiotransferase MtaB [Rickettsia endosymbiont of Cardiosporidium cionae]|uniref:tRNA (N(6)-L-threonylcarbamoyladenosine(37)-C(2))- methylthiotransferase MtaB n=1 Tax=Rickettsia endosymbiont of Cardiosporidium cionae TaxID=2777155 RepID=UPI00189383D2|nr:tRNA (N(6)-L-threonylcarbamoyladenosine(37)-C(2))-methylthiotransferase MtaB [Rickettsia endosymbiont of Cardiosporidium cionae]KAF8818356.1 tRNA (N(6)-L-threonylcarbamoyladenosine(37)-C(2))-methylthiotransferase MtaB [Rickettsia endosymbiont of Cardiosporidium cionae]